MIARVSLRLIVFVGVGLIASAVVACKLPVFRYALERWPADRYQLVAIVDEGSRADASEALSLLQQLGDSNANVDVETIDLSQLSEQQLWQIDGLDGSEEPPRLQVFFPLKDGQRKLCWTGPLTPATIAMWRDSPWRQQIVAEITSGVSAVWILVEGSDAAENERLASQLNQAIARAEKEISIPEGVISRQQAASYLQQHPGASMDDVLRSDIPLKIDFVMRRLPVNADEPAVRAMVSGWNDASETGFGRAFVFPVFGRGRMIEPLWADQFSVDAVVGACRYMVGECNCTLKALNPGVDLLLEANWKDYMDETLVVVEPAVPKTPQALVIPAGSTAVETPPSPKPADSPLASTDSFTRWPAGPLVVVAAAIAMIAAMGLWRRRC
jgi:hypothetical protein